MVAAFSLLTALLAAAKAWVNLGKVGSGAPFGWSYSTLLPNLAAELGDYLVQF